jgi:hypothetical protein
MGADEATGGAATVVGAAMSAEDRARVIAASRVAEFMRKKKVTLDDLINVGGADLKSSNSKLAEKARRVSKCWELIARLEVKFADIEHFEQSPRPIPGLEARIRRGSEKDSGERLRT